MTRTEEEIRLHISPTSTCHLYDYVSTARDGYDPLSSSKTHSNMCFFNCDDFEKEVDAKLSGKLFRKVHFPTEIVVSVVMIERPSEEVAKELFYSHDDFSRFCVEANCADCDENGEDLEGREKKVELKPLAGCKRRLHSETMRRTGDKNSLDVEVEQVTSTTPQNNSKVSEDGDLEEVEDEDEDDEYVPAMSMHYAYSDSDDDDSDDDDDSHPDDEDTEEDHYFEEDMSHSDDPLMLLQIEFTDEVSTLA
jgi:hypothetical protein